MGADVKFTYRAKDQFGFVVQGEIDAQDRTKAEIELRLGGLEPIDVSESEHPQGAKKTESEESGGEVKRKGFKQTLLFAIIIIIVFAGGYFYGKMSNPEPSFQQEPNPFRNKKLRLSDDQHRMATDRKKPLATTYFKINDPRIVRNYHANDNPSRCTSLEFKATIVNLTGQKKTIHTEFFLKDAQGFVLLTDRGFYEIDANSGTKEPRVIVTFSSGNLEDFSCKDVVSVELRYSSSDDEFRNVSIDLPLIDGL